MYVASFWSNGISVKGWSLHNILPKLISFLHICLLITWDYCCLLRLFLVKWAKYKHQSHEIPFGQYSVFNYYWFVFTILYRQIKNDWDILVLYCSGDWICYSFSSCLRIWNGIGLWLVSSCVFLNSSEVYMLWNFYIWWNTQIQISPRWHWHSCLS